MEIRHIAGIILWAFVSKGFHEQWGTDWVKFQAVVAGLLFVIIVSTAPPDMPSDKLISMLSLWVGYCVCPPLVQGLTEKLDEFRRKVDR